MTREFPVNMAGDAASALKQKGNEHFKAGKMMEAIKLYAQAEKADPHDPVYPSNHSAALYEVGDYSACAAAVIRSWTLLQDNPDAKPDLIVRLSSRLAKSLCYAVRAGTITKDFVATWKEDIMQLQEAAAGKPLTSVNVASQEEFARVWEEWECVKLEMEDYYSTKCGTSLQGLSRLPMFIGTDDIIDLTAGWGNGYPYPLEISKLPPQRLSDLAFFFGGVGDGRHVLGTLCGLRLAFDKLSKEKKKRFRAHLTLLDIHEGQIARLLLLFHLLHSYNICDDAEVRDQIKATFMYMFCGLAMPPYCSGALKTIIKFLLECLSTNDPRGMPPMVHVSPSSTGPLLKILDFWTKLKKAQGVPFAGWLPGSKGVLRTMYESGNSSEREQIKNMLLTAEDKHLYEFKLVPEGGTPDDARAMIKDNLESFVDTFQKLFRHGKVLMHEEVWYKYFKVFYPPRELLDRHIGFEAAMRQIRGAEDLSPVVQDEIWAEIEEYWEPNVTFFDLKTADPHCYEGGDGYPGLNLDMFRATSEVDVFNRRNSPRAKDYPRTDANLLTSEACGKWFEETAAALKVLGKKVKIELVVGGLSEELWKMQVGGDTARPKEFPPKFTRMWLSNVPDYTHGILNMAVCTLPSLQDDPQAAVACNSLLNTGAWANDEQFIHTYSLLLPEEIPRYLACRLIDARPVLDILALGSQSHPRPLSELATREEITTWLTRLLFNTFIPGHTGFRPANVRLPHNLVAFFAILMYLHRIGYPAHWLSEFLARILSGKVHSDIRQYDDFYPIPVSERTVRVKPRTVRTDPWLVEFETILATAYHGIPFPIATALPPDFSRNASDIAVWEVAATPAQVFSTRPMFNFSSPYDPRAQLLVYRSDIASAGTLIDDIQKVFEGRATPAPGTFFVLTALEYVHYVERIRFKLSRRRVERMRRESARWSVMAYRNDTGQQATLPVPIKKWVLVNENE
ncbi:hypothetical protein LXA43DRAFT_1034112 [Ganoderma leucocontextum]|nr:hypothetical protein LXA43DRAFT_1034112 [Ganoderma leucocontextum]